MITKQKRPYEMSIWTLQDSYITTLKAIGENGKNQIQEPKIDLNIDGTQTLSFTIPMYYYNEEGIKVENPKWYNTINGNLIASLRKIKVIINKQRAQEKVIEFIITKVTERHEKAELYCDVECEGLAFHELGKTGYKITLSSDDFYAADLKWFQENGQIEENQPHATINWWCDQFLTPCPTNGEAIDPLTWYYKVDMDWSGYSEFNGSGLAARDSSKIYEEEYISSWDFKTKTIDMGNNQSITINEKVVPSAEEAYKEKERIVDFSESNKYNLTQSLAEAFGVFCKYEYTYDDAYHIIGRTVIFYNSFLKEDPIDITYKYDTSSISRNMDGTDIVTKMYVRPVDSDINDSGWITILDVDANKSKEDYILNFDYLYSIGAIDDDAYGEIENYEMQMREKNMALIPIQEQLTSLNVELPEAQAQQTLAANAIQLDKERLTAADDLLHNLTDGEDVIHVTDANPDNAILLQRDVDAPGVYYIKITTPGIDVNTLKIYTTMNFSAVNDRLTNEIVSGEFKYDEFMNLVEVSNLIVSTTNSRIVYLTYDYTPKLQYERVKQTWEARLEKDTKDKEEADTRIEQINNAIEALKRTRDDLLDQKKEIMNNFERLMGAAIREGFWQPDSYKDYGNKYVSDIKVSLTSESATTDLVQFIWDNHTFEGEQKLTYKVGAAVQDKYYPCIDISNFSEIKDHLDTLSFIYLDQFVGSGDTAPAARYYRSMSLGSEMALAFIRPKGDNNNDSVIPVLMLLGAEHLSDEYIEDYIITDGNEGEQTILPCLGNLFVNTTLSPVQVDITQYIAGGLTWINFNDEEYEIVYPRIAINSTELKTSEDQLSVKYDNTNLVNYQDYYVLNETRVLDEDEGIDKKSYITIKPEVLIKHAIPQTITNPNAQIKFTLSNAALEIYLDAIEVEKESAFPRVSYDLKVDMVREEFVTYLYNLLNRVANINDWELHFENVQGYISKVSLNLDQPWEDSLEIQNYKTKFEDLFAKIVASTEQMQKNQYTVNVASQAFDSFGNLQADAATVKLPIELNKGKVIIDKEQGIVSINDNGMVVFRGDGIFTANEQDENGNWIWHSAVLPQGINADSITTGQLDTNLINVYSGDNLKFQLKDDGLFAYKTISTDDNLMNANSTVKADLNANYKNNTDYKQYVVHNEDGLFLHAEPGAKVAKNNGDLITVANPVDRVEVSWDGLVLRNWVGDRTLYADPDTGNLVIEGTIIANALQIGYSSGTTDSIEAYVNNQIATNNTLNTTLADLQAQIDGEVDTWFYVGTPKVVNNRLIIERKNLSIVYDIESQWGLNWSNDAYDNESLKIIARHEADVYYDIGKPEQSDTASRAFRFVVTYDQNTHQINSYSWEVITNTAMTEALGAAAHAQSTADGKIRTFYAGATYNTEFNPARIWPNISSNINLSEGDLWVNADNKNMYYRYNAVQETWVLIRDVGITEAQSIAAQAQTDANAAYALAQDINNGTRGLSFLDDAENVTVTLNKQDGLKIVGYQGSYFQVNNQAMGFFDNNAQSRLVFYNGDMWLYGGISTSKGQIGPWVLDSNSIYYNQSTFGASGGLYWGTQGLSLSDAVQIKMTDDPNNSNQKILESLKFHDSTQDQDLLTFERDDEGNYKLSFQNVSFDTTVLDALDNSLSQYVYPAMSKEQLDSYSNVPYGSLGVVYANGSTSDISINFENQLLNNNISGWTRDPKSLYPVITSFTTDNGNISSLKGLSRDYHYRWSKNSDYDKDPRIGSGGHFDQNTTYINIWGSKDAYIVPKAKNGSEKDGYYVRAGYGSAPNRGGTAYAVFTASSNIFSTQTSQTVPANTTFNIDIPYISTKTLEDHNNDWISLTGGVVYEAPDKPLTAVTLDIFLYWTNRPDLTYNKTDQLNYNPNYNALELRTIELGKTSAVFSTGGTIKATITISQDIDLEVSSCLYVLVKASQYIANSLKLIDINNIQLNTNSITETGKKGLYYYAPETPNDEWKLIQLFS